MRLKLIGCDIAYRELCAVAVKSPNRVDLEFLPQGLHSLETADMLSRLQNAVDAAEGGGYDAVLIGYGLCGNGVIGLAARSTKLVVPRAHDCITFFLGGKEIYKEYFYAHVGEYFLTTGWFERCHEPDSHPQFKKADPYGMNRSREELIAKFGEEDAEMILAELGDGIRNYHTHTFIRMGVEPDGSFQARARDEAARKGWKFKEIDGSLSLLQALADGPWPEDAFLTVPPGHRIAPRYDDSLMAAEHSM